MAEFVIKCPWCRQDSEFSVSSLAAVSVQSIHVVDGVDHALYERVDQSLDEAEKAGRLFKCANLDCLAPFEALICRGLEPARRLQQFVSGVAWSSPRRFRLPKNKLGGRCDDVFGVLFNRKPLARWREIHLSNLVNVRIIAKYLVAYAERSHGPVTLFEAWASDRANRIFWIPVQPLGAKQIGVAPNYRETCLAFRRVFEAKAIEELAADRATGRPCPYERECAAGRVCLKSASSVPNISDRCLRWLELREQYSPCYQSDLAIINRMVLEFEKGDVDQLRPYQDVCWTGYQELVFPLVVHDHLVGAVMTGQFDTDQSPQTVEDALRAEADWHASRGVASPQLLLAGSREALQPVFPQSPHAVPTTYQLTRQREADLREDIEHLATLTVERYLRQRHLSESAFRLELGGTLTLHQLRGDDFADVLPHLLRRMRDFWAFEHVCLCMMADWEEDLRLYATEDDFFGPMGTAVGAPSLGESARENVTQTLLFAQGVRPRSEDQMRWQEILEKLGNLNPEMKEPAQKQWFIVVVSAGPRSYVFVFAGRDKGAVSRLPYPADRSVRLSDECREQVMRTCDHVAGQLHNFWARYDQEQTYRILSHALRMPLTLMQMGSGTLRSRLEQEKQAVQASFPGIYDSAQVLFESLRRGAEMVDDELKGMSATPNLESLLERAVKGTTDLVSVINKLAPQFRWRARLAGRMTRRAIEWEFRVSGKAEIVGDVDVIRLAVGKVLDNAFKYSYAGRKIVVAVNEADLGWELKITNKGVPVAKDELSLVWQRNYRGRYARRRRSKAEEGTGYGLYVVKAIVEAAGGRVSMNTDFEPHLDREPSDVEAETVVKLEFRGAREEYQ